MDGVGIKEDIKDESLVQVGSPLFESARLLGDGVGSDPFDCGRDATVDSMKEEIFAGRGDM